MVKLSTTEEVNKITFTGKTDLDLDLNELQLVFVNLSTGEEYLVEGTLTNGKRPWLQAEVHGDQLPKAEGFYTLAIKREANDLPLVWEDVVATWESITETWLSENYTIFEDLVNNLKVYVEYPEGFSISEPTDSVTYTEDNTNLSEIEHPTELLNFVQNRSGIIYITSQARLSQIDQPSKEDITYNVPRAEEDIEQDNSMLANITEPSESETFTEPSKITYNYGNPPKI